ncbi:glycerol kinase [Fomitiporia mediterranea MF3/22]|uniref:glycerol kinase n=1 Tax=Fomitiporia mediterranea (strain MF3/22) TaxID=694068 RepID=UPI0004409101|nr:glycerol kinase [Fomitiporia mediterranea MF3/22]EJD07328.1 glycerol kinase [Fomitiporia mediterranea MF3/22]
MSNLKQAEFVASLDCGTTSVRFIIFDARAVIVAQCQLEFPQYYPHPGWHEHDADEIQQVSEQCIEQACKELEKSGWTRSSIKVIGITNQRETAVAWDRMTGRPLCRAIVWDDARTKGTVAHFQHKLRVDGLEVAPGDFRKGDAGVAALRELTGLPLSTYFSAIKLCWMIENHDNVRTAHDTDNLCFGTVESWLVYNFTGGHPDGLHITEPTNASRTLLLDIHSLQWSPALLRFFSLRPSILPRLVSSSEVYGNLKSGSLTGVPIAGLVGDQQGALVGNKCLHQGQAKCTYGTGAFLLFNTGRKAVTSEHGLLTTVAYQPGPGKKAAYALEGSIAVAGSAINWLRDSMGLIQTSAEVNTLAAKEPTTGGVYFVTAFSGLLAPYWDPGAAGTLIGRAALEAIAFQTRAVIESMLLDASSNEAKAKSRVKSESNPGSLPSGSLSESDFESPLSSPVVKEQKPMDPLDGDPSLTNKHLPPSPQLEPLPTSLVAVVPGDSNSAASNQPKSTEEKDSNTAAVEFTHLKVDGGVTNGDLCMQILADIGGFSVVRPTMRESTALGSALLAGAAVGLFGWDLEKPDETMREVNTEGARTFEPGKPVEEREQHWGNWKRAVERSLGWDEAPDE